MSFIQKISGNVYLNDINAGKTLRQLRSESKKLRNELQDLGPASQEFVEKSKKLKDVNTRYSELNGTLRAQEGAFSRAANWANKYFNVIVGMGLAIAGIAAGIKGWINGLTGLADAESDVMKTTGMTREEVRGLNDDFRALNTRTARLELMKLAEEAGRLGMTSKRDILDFVESANQINVALGDDLGEGATRIIGKMVDNFRVAKREGVDFGEAMLKVGSSLNELAASGPSQADYIVEFTNRLTAVANQAEMTETQIMGIGALLDEKAMKLEMSSTAVNRVILEMGSNIGTYAEMAGIEVDEFRHLVETDANQALITFLDGLKANANGLEEMTARLSDLDQDGIRAITVLMTLADNTDRLAELQGIANKAFEEGTSASKEYALRNDNLAGSWEKIQKYLNRIFLNSTLMNAVERFVGMIAKWTDIKLSDKIEDERVALRALEIQLFNTNVPQEQKVKMLEQLKTEYPKYFEGIDIHTAKEEDLKRAIDNTVTSLINRRIEMLQDERVTESLEKNVDAELKLRSVSTEARKEMVRVAEKYGIAINKNLKLSEQMHDVYNQVKAQFDARKETMGGVWFSAAARLEVLSREVGQRERESEKAGKEYNQVLDERNMILEELNYQNQKSLNSLVLIGEEQKNQENDENTPPGGGDPAERLGTSAVIQKHLFEAQEIVRIEEDKNKKLESMQRDHQITLHKQKQDYWEATHAMQAEWGKQSVEAEMELQTLVAHAIEGGLFMIASMFRDNAEVTKAMFILSKGAAIAEVIIKAQQEMASLRVSQAMLVAQLTPISGPAAAGIAAGIFEPILAASKVRAGISIGTIMAQAIPAFKINPTMGRPSMRAGRYSGGYTASSSGEYGFDEDGRSITGYHHANEYVIPEWMMMQAPVANIAKQLENIRQTGGSAGTKVVNHYSSTSTTDMSGVERRLDEMKGGMNQSRGIDETALARAIVTELIRSGNDVFAVREMTTIKKKRK